MSPSELIGLLSVPPEPATCVKTTPDPATPAVVQIQKAPVRSTVHWPTDHVPEVGAPLVVAPA
jgi:hypothetical protein